MLQASFLAAAKQQMHATISIRDLALLHVMQALVMHLHQGYNWSLQQRALLTLSAESAHLQL